MDEAGYSGDSNAATITLLQELLCTFLHSIRCTTITRSIPQGYHERNEIMHVRLPYVIVAAGAGTAGTAYPK